MPEGGTLTLRSFGSQHHVTVEVCATGVGMTERGTGLGLAMVYGMAERHGAELEIDSEAGVGTVVRLMFPVVPPGEATSSVITDLGMPPASPDQRRLRADFNTSA